MSNSKPKPEAPERCRFSAERKADAVVRLMRDEDLDTLPRELGIIAATLWTSPRMASALNRA